MRALVALLLVCGFSAALASPVSEEDLAPEGDDEGPRDHPCASHVCEPGQECKLDDEELPFCTCIEQCSDRDFPVCSTSNVTFSNECELERQVCLCRDGKDGCAEDSNADLVLDYFGDCRELQECHEHEMEQFPVRMRDWLFIVMEELAKRKELPESYEGWAKMAEEEEKHWLLPVVWKFCELDSDPEDRRVRRQELLHLSASLKAMEYCISPFLDGCDTNDDDQITLHEWGQCLGMSEDEATKFENHCIAIHSKDK